MNPTDEQSEPLANEKSNEQSNEQSNEPAKGNETGSSSDMQPIKPVSRSMFDAPLETEQSALADPLTETEANSPVEAQVDAELGDPIAAPDDAPTEEPIDAPGDTAMLAQMAAAQDPEDTVPAEPTPTPTPTQTKLQGKAKPKAKPKATVKGKVKGKATEQPQSKLELDALADKYAQSNESSSEERVDTHTDTDPAVYDEIELTATGADGDRDLVGNDEHIVGNDQNRADDDQDIADNDQGDPYGGHSPERLKNILEAALFASGTTLSASHLRGLFEIHERPHGRIVRQLMAELIAHYSGRGLLLVEVASGYRFQTATETASWVARLWEEKPQRYSRALMETIALIAYRQPITRGEIEDVRGVAVSSNIIRTLLEREWVRVVGHRDVPGRPAMYATTRQFLDYFSLVTLDQMPSLGEIRDMEELNPQMPLNAETDENDAEDKQQAEISFSGLIDKIRDSAVSGKTGNEFIDEQLDQELQAMDNVNASFEQALAQQKAEHEHPDLNLNYDDSDPAATEQADLELAVTPEPVPAPAAEVESELEPPLSEEEQWKSIQQKLAQQQALLDARENDSDPEENDNE